MTPYPPASPSCRSVRRRMKQAPQSSTPTSGATPRDYRSTLAKGKASGHGIPTQGRRLSRRSGAKVDVRSKSLTTSIHESQAHANEMLLIQRYGRRDTGTGSLVNMTDGGDGSSGLCEEARRKISAANKGNQYAVGMIRSDETRARISASKQGQASRLGAILTEVARKNQFSIARTKAQFGSSSQGFSISKRQA